MGFSQISIKGYNNLELYHIWSNHDSMDSLNITSYNLIDSTVYYKKSFKYSTNILIEKCQYFPLNGKKKMYIFDDFGDLIKIFEEGLLSFELHKINPNSYIERSFYLGDILSYSEYSLGAGKESIQYYLSDSTMYMRCEIVRKNNNILQTTVLFESTDTMKTNILLNQSEWITSITKSYSNINEYNTRFIFYSQYNRPLSEHYIVNDILDYSVIYEYDEHNRISKIWQYSGFNESFSTVSDYEWYIKEDK